MRLEVTVPTTLGAPDDPATLDVVAATISVKATAWSTPVYIGERDGLHIYATDAQPRPTGIVTTANIAPTRFYHRTSPDMAHRFRTIPTRNTTAAGYGNEHMKERRRRLAATTPADRCGYCGLPLGPERLPGDKQSRWALPHRADRRGYEPGMWHRHCNNLDGARRGRARQGRGIKRAQSRSW